MLKKTGLSLLSIVFSLQGEMKVQGHLDLDSQFYVTNPDSKHDNSFTAKQTLELEYTEDKLTLYAQLYAQEAYYDLLNTSKQTKRTFARIDELYMKLDYEDDSIEVGKSIKFWGALELRNIVDVFNPNEFRDDMFKTNKLGAWNTSYTHYTDSGELSLIIKVAEQEQRMAAFPYTYYLFSEEVSYDSNLVTSSNEHRPSVYLTYSGTTDTQYALDYAFIYENGYDSQRYFSSIINQPATYQQHAYIVNKFMTYNTLVVGSTLIKLEALYAVAEEKAPISDYSHIAFGIEHTIENFYDSAALGLIVEYYKYNTYESGKYNDLQLFQTMQNDLFIGARYTLNNANDTSVVGGIIHDSEYNEQTYYVKLESRLMDGFRLELDYYYIEPSKKEKTAYAYLGRHQRIGLNIAYYF